MVNNSAYTLYLREDWKKLSDFTAIQLSEEELSDIQSINDKISIEDVNEVYLPLSQLIYLQLQASHTFKDSINHFLNNDLKKGPFIIGIAGSVAVGKSTTARLLQKLLSQLPSHPKVDLVTTDGFLLPNAELEKRGIMKKKGFPESYDTRSLISFLTKVKSGVSSVQSPVYSHLTYDIVPNEFITIENPDILIVEGLNVLQTSLTINQCVPNYFVSDFFDFSIYVDADVNNIEKWYIDRFIKLRDTAFQDEQSYFKKYAQLSLEESIEISKRIWKEINFENLIHNILPTRNRADLILFKNNNHHIDRIKLRK
ncbi:type I pantothenate kinase [Paenibacillus sp. FSL K6-3166]|uniref:type I pantothenate kinase n=1 Tax=unclassified Paenibacillus TaxID=185978 RepID=UPI000BA0CE5A|nr:type I pantothenate kinase [Paenibacillus sp. VTT E-133291]OZQ88780.1 type I pantothenate kinase [Paenibacillus sp. VTT E-133291]